MRWKKITSGFYIMEVKFKVPTINQLVRKGRKTAITKSTAPALQKGYNSKKKRQTNNRAPQ